MGRCLQCPLYVRVSAAVWTFTMWPAGEMFLLIALLQPREPLSASPLSFSLFLHPGYSLFSPFISSPAFCCSTGYTRNSSITLVRLCQRQSCRFLTVHENDSSSLSLECMNFTGNTSPVLHMHALTCVSEYLLVWVETADNQCVSEA